jgi:hypothetical protein
VKEVAILAVRALLGGTFVALFSVLGELLRPKSFAGIFAAAPSVALALLLVTDATKGSHAVWLSGVGMVGGAVTMLAACGRHRGGEALAGAARRPRRHRRLGAGRGRAVRGGAAVSAEVEVDGRTLVADPRRLAGAAALGD